MAGRTRYSQNAGLMAARKAVAAFNSEYLGLPIEPTEVMLTCGGMEAIFLMLTALINPGDEVIIPGPYWINYKQMTELCGGRAVIVPTREEDNFALTADSLRSAITKRTRVLILNSPNNPTGRIIPPNVLDAISRLAVKNDIFVISDEVYRSLVYDGKNNESIWTRPKMRERCAIIDSMSKRYSMTGYRLGVAIAPQELVLAMTRLQENVAACAPLPSQYAAIAGYGHSIRASYIVKEFSRRRNVIIRGIRSIKRLSISGIDGTFYAFVNISKTGLTSYDFAMRLLKNQHVAVVPGKTYGEMYDNYIRIAFTLACDKLKIALGRIDKFVKEI